MSAQATANGSPSLEQLHSPEQQGLLDAVDTLRRQGVSHHDIGLPQLIVVGDQSSGKSSVLEGLTRLKFPTKDALCTTFPTELVLRRSIGPEVKIICSITPGEKRTKEQKHRLEQFERVYTSRDDFAFPALVDEARQVMQIGSTAFSKDILRIRYTGPDVPSLTIVDLPGLIHSETEQHVDGNPQRIEELVRSYMHDQRSIILAVVSARNDINNQVIVRYVREAFDSMGSRTLGIITKPDTLDAGSDSEDIFVRLAKNQTVKFELGWHVVKNRSYSTRDATDTERDASEAQFLSSGVWNSVPRPDVGIDTLRTKLSKLLLQQIRKELPSLVLAIEEKIQDTTSSLQALGSPRDTPERQRMFLSTKAKFFEQLTKQALEGTYNNNPFFALSETDGEPATRLRTEIQNLNIEFMHTVYTKGHTWHVVDDNMFPESGRSYSPISIDHDYDPLSHSPREIRRTEYLECIVGRHVRESLGAGLPNLVNPGVIAQVFQEQSAAWENIAKAHVEAVYDAVKTYVTLSLASLMDSRTSNMLMLEHVQLQLDRRYKAMTDKVEEILKPFTTGDPLIYDPEFNNEITALRKARSTQDGGTLQTNSGSSERSAQRLLAQSHENFTNSDILDLVQTYYKRAMFIFINNIAILAIENCLIADVPAIFEPLLVLGMDEDLLCAIASEAPEVHEKRTALTQKLEVLKEGKRTLQREACKSGTVVHPQARTRRLPSRTMESTPMSISRPETPPPHASNAETIKASPPSELVVPTQFPPTPPSSVKRVPKRRSGPRDTHTLSIRPPSEARPNSVFREWRQNALIGHSSEEEL